MAGRVLVVDDEADVCRLLAFNLEDAGFEVFQAQSGADALLMAAKKEPHVIVLDLMLPDLSGLDVCKRIRSDNDLAHTGILMLTARGSDEERVMGLAAGADDYVVKPFHTEEIVLRVGALWRRVGEYQSTELDDNSKAMSCGAISVNPVTHIVRVDGEAVKLRPLEYKLLAVLVADPGRVFSRGELIQKVWEIDHVSSPRIVDVHVRRLRQNLGSASDTVETVPGFGYRLRSES